MAKSKLARRVRKLRNLRSKGITCFHVNVVDGLHAQALKRAFTKARYRWDTCPYFGVYDGEAYILTYDNEGDYKAGHNTAFFDHDGGYPCVKL